MKIGDIVYLRGFNVFAEIINMGTESYGDTWYRTDMEGIRYASEMTEISSMNVLDGLIKNADKIFSPTEKKHIGKLRKKLKTKEYISKL